MNFYEILKTKKLGRGSPDYWTQLFAEHVGGKGDWKIVELTGTLPITFRSDGTALIDYRIYGTADGAGVQTENLFDCRKNYHGETDITVAGVRFLYGNQSITLSQTANGSYPQQQISGEDGILTLVKNTQYYGKLYIDNAPENANIYMLLQVSTDGSSYTRITTIRSAGVTFTPNDDYIAYRWLFVAEGEGFTYNNTIVKFAIVEGSTAPDHFIPYGYKLPLTVTSGTESKDTDIYIGDSKLLSGDYVDYESGKIVRNGTPQDPPLPLPAIETFKGTNTLDSTETLGEVTIKGQIKPQS